MRTDYYTKIIADSEINNNRITTFEITFPRFIAEQILTHRMLSRNAGSLRATPTHKIINFASCSPLTFKANQPGMVAGERLKGVRAVLAKAGWELARLGARCGAALLNAANCHKEITNRVLTPFLWQTFVVTSNRFGWDNFFQQRVSPHSQPEINYTAALMRLEYEQNTPEPTIHHIPYDPIYDHNSKISNLNERKQISTARIARVSLFNHGSDSINYEKDIALYERLKHSEHYSPFDHVLTYTNKNETNNFHVMYPGWKSLREELFPQFIQER